MKTKDNQLVNQGYDKYLRKVKSHEQMGEKRHNTTKQRTALPDRKLSNHEIHNINDKKDTYLLLFIFL